MKKLLLGMTAGLLSLTAFGQSFYYIAKTGAGDVYNLSTTLNSGTKILDKPNNDVLSSAQTIPFSFNFGGAAYTSYKASDNGYITFNTSATTSVNAASNLPAGADPNNAIYAFWKNWELKSAPNTAFPVGVWNYTFGTAPNRVHVIQWYGASPSGGTIAANSDVACFAILLYEGSEGRADVVFNGVFGTSSYTGTCGVENSDGSKGLHVGAGSGFNFPFNSTSDNASLKAYSFYFGNQPSLDMTVLTCDMPNNIVKGADNDITGTIANYGSTAITSFRLNYSIDGGTAVSQPVTGVNIGPNGGTFSYVHPIPVNEPTAGVFHTLKVWATLLNGSADENTANDAYNMNYVAKNNTTAVRNVLFEEATGAWCQHCPDAHTYMDNLKTNHADRVIIAVHHNVDGMNTAEGDLVNAAYAQGYPNGYIDRSLVGTQTTVGQSRSAWDGSVTTQKGAYTPASVAVKDISYNAATGLITATVEATFTDYYVVPGEIRLGCMIKEAYIRGGTGNVPNTTAPLYDQIIASTYTTNPAHPFYGRTSPMHGYYHKNVVIDIPSGAWGKAGSVTPTKFNPGEKVSATFTYTLPGLTNATINPATAQWGPTGTIIGRNKPMDIWVVGFLTKYAANTGQRQVINAAETKMWNTTAEVKTADNANQTITLFPNTANDHSFVSFDLPQAENVTITITDINGKVIETAEVTDLIAGSNSVNINTSTYTNGVYMVNVKSANFSASSRLMVAH